MRLARTALTLVFLLGITLVASSAANAVPMMNIDIGGSGSSTSIGVGDTITVSLFGNDIPAGADLNGLFGFGFAITYDDSVLTSSDATAGPLWVSTGFSNFRNDPGDVGVLANRFFLTSGPVGDNILLASIDFTGALVGLSDLTVSYFTGGPGDNNLFDMTVLDSSPSFFESGSIEVVPEPQTALLLSMGLTFLGARCRRQRFDLA